MYDYNGKIQSWRSMIEMLGVLAIIGILSAGGIAGYYTAMQSYKGNQLIERVQLISLRVRTVYKNSYLGINNTNLIDSGKISSKDLEKPFGGELSVTSMTYGGQPGFQIQTNQNIPIGVCTDILTTDFGDLIH